MSEPVPLPDTVERARMANTRHEGGSLEMFAPPQAHILVTRAIGHMTRQMAEVWVERAEALFTPTSGPLAIFNEWSAMSSYEPDSRRLLTRWVLDHKKRIEGAWFLMSSKIVVVGVAIAGLATATAGITMHASLNRQAWEHILQERLTRSR